MKEAENCESNYMIGWCNGQCNNDVHALAHSLGSQARMIINFLKWINSFPHPSIHPSNAKMWTSERAIPLCLECRHITLIFTWKHEKCELHGMPSREKKWNEKCTRLPISLGTYRVAQLLSLTTCRFYFTRWRVLIAQWHSNVLLSLSRFISTFYPVQFAD